MGKAGWMEAGGRLAQSFLRLSRGSESGSAEVRTKSIPTGLATVLSSPHLQLLLLGMAEQGKEESRHPTPSLRNAGKKGRSFSSSARRHLYL